MYFFSLRGTTTVYPFLFLAKKDLSRYNLAAKEICKRGTAA